MKKIYLLLTMLLMLVGASPTWADDATLTVYDGTASNYQVPVFGYRCDSYTKTEIIMPAATLSDMADGTIKGLKFYLKTKESSSYGNANFVVFLKEVAATTVSGSFNGYTSEDVVYEGALDATQDVMDITFTKTYSYGGGNLLIGIYNTAKGSAGVWQAAYYYGESATSGSSAFGYSSKSLSDASSVYAASFLPKTTFTYAASTCKRPKNLSASEITDESATITWDAGEADTWNLRYKAADDADYTEVNGLTSATYSLEGLDAATTYTVEVQTVCSLENQSTWSAVEFTTPLCNPSVQKTISYELHDQYTDGWNGASITITDVTSGIVIATLTISTGNSASGTVSLCPNREYSFTWTKGSYDSECSYTIKDVDDNDLFTHAQGASTTAGALGDNYSWSDAPVVGAKFAINTDGTTQDFGFVAQNAVEEKTFTVTNSGSAALPITFTDATDFYVAKKVMFTKPNDWSQVNLYVWDSSNNALNGSWPGNAMTLEYTNDYGEQVWSATLPKDAAGIIFSNNGSSQTSDIPTTGFKQTIAYYLDNNTPTQWMNADFSVPAKSGDDNGSASFTIRMVTTTTGAKSGNIVLAFDAVNGTEFTIPVSGYVADNTKMFVDFSGNALPDGWTNSTNSGAAWTFADGVAYGQYANYKNAKMTSPLLTVGDGESLVFQTKGNTTYADMKVNVFDRNWNTIKTVDFSTQARAAYTAGQYTLVTLSDLDAGDYRLEFEAYNSYIDNINGFTVNPNDPKLGIYTDAECTVAATTTVTKDFGFVTADPTPATYYIKNDGTGTMTLSKGSDPAGLSVTLDKTSVAAGEHATLTIAMPVADNGGYHGGDVVVTATDLGTFTVTVQGVVVEEGKQNLNFATDDRPSSWTGTYWTKDANGYLSQPSWNNYSLETSTLVAEAGEVLVVVAQQTTTTGSYTFGVKYKDADDANAEWADLIPAAYIGTSEVMLHGTIAAAGNYLLQFNGQFSRIYRIYGLSKPNAPEMVVYDGENVAGASYSFGKVTDEADATHTFTVKNEGLAKLEGLAVALGGDNATHYNVAITGATGAGNDEIEAGAQATITVTQLKDNLGAHSATLTISATDLDDKVITLSGNTVDHTALNIDFDSSNAWPTEILSHDGWTIYNYSGSGYAYNMYSTAYSLILTPLTVTNLADKLTFQSKYYNSSARDLTVRYTTDGGVTWNDYNCGTVETPETSFKSQITSSYKDFEVTNIPVGTAAFEFYGKSIYLDNIAGDMKVTSAPLVEFTEVSDNISGANLQADATASYTLKNIGNADYVATVAASGVTVAATGEGVTYEGTTLTVPAGKTATITATMAFAAPYGVKNSSLAITSESWVGDINKAYTATLVDPTDFVETFTSKPAGWYYDTWTVTDGVARINSGTAKKMITEKIGAETGKNVLSFDTKLYYDYGYGTYTLNVYTSTDRKNWGEAKKTVTLTADVQTVTLDALADGEYYVMFEAANATVDNISGVKRLEAPTHDLYEVSTTMNTEGVTPGASYTATVNAVSLRAAETVTAELWMQKGDEAAIKVSSLTEQAMAVGTTKAFALTGDMPSVEGDYKIWATIYNNDVVITTDKKDITLAHTAILTVNSFEVAASPVQADDNNQYTATYYVTVQNTGSRALTAGADGEVSVTLVDNADAEHTFTSKWTAENSNVLYMNTTKDAIDLATDDAKLGVWMWGKSEGEWGTFTKINDGFYSVDLNGNTGFIVVRQDPSADFSLDTNWGKTADMSLANGNIIKINTYNDGVMTFTSETMGYLDPTMTTTLKVNVTGTLTDGENASFAFKAKEDLADKYYGSGLTRTVNITAAPVIVLDETSSAEFATGQNRKVQLTRSFVEGWNTICLPFETPVNTFGAEATAYAFNAYTTGLQFASAATLEAGKPYLIHVPAANNGSTPFELSGVTVSNTLTPATDNGASFIGTFEPKTAGLLTGKYGVTKTGKIQKAGEGASMKGFRAYFELPANAKVSIIITDADGNTTNLDDYATGINRLFNDGTLNPDEPIYNTQGQQVSKSYRGVVIQNGKKFVIK